MPEKYNWWEKERYRKRKEPIKMKKTSNRGRRRRKRYERNARIKTGKIWREGRNAGKM